MTSNHENYELDEHHKLRNMGWMFIGHYIDSGHIEESTSARLIREAREVGLEAGEHI